jgi:hypothetical protein
LINNLSAFEKPDSVVNIDFIRQPLTEELLRNGSDESGHAVQISIMQYEKTLTDINLNI